jgi:hypothetical protein
VSCNQHPSQTSSSLAGTLLSLCLHPVEAPRHASSAKLVNRQEAACTSVQAIQAVVAQHLLHINTTHRR